MTSVKEDSLTQKEEKAIEAYLANGDKTEAIKEAYPDSTTPKVLAQEVFNRPRVKRATEIAMTKLGITPEQILGRFVKQADKGKNEAAKVRANENLAQMADLYPDRHLIDASDSDINITVSY